MPSGIARPVLDSRAPTAVGALLNRRGDSEEAGSQRRPMGRKGAPSGSQRMHPLLVTSIALLATAQSCNSPPRPPRPGHSVPPTDARPPAPATLASTPNAKPNVSSPPEARILRCPDLSRFDEGRPKQSREALARFVTIMRHVPIGDAPAASLTLGIENSARGPVVLARGTPEQLDAVASALAHLRTNGGTARLQCSIVMLPNRVARAHQLEPGKTLLANDTEWTDLIRDAIKAYGSVHNFPETLGGWLAPFEQQMPATTNQPALRLSGEVLPLGDRRIALAVSVARPSQADALATPVFTLAPGTSAMMMVPYGNGAVVVIARCLEVCAPAER